MGSIMDDAVIKWSLRVVAVCFAAAVLIFALLFFYGSLIAIAGG